MIYILSKLFTAFFLPPGLFVTLAAVAAYFLRRCRPILLIGAGWLYLLSTPYLSEHLIASLEEPWRHATLPTKVDLVVSLGHRTSIEGPVYLSGEGLSRHLYAYSLACRYGVPLLITGGSRHGISSPEAFKKTLQALNLPPCPNTTILPEAKSRDTYENARYTRHLIDAKASVVLVTSAYHMNRAIDQFQRAGFRALYPAAVNFYGRHANDTPTIWEDLLPNIGALRNTYLVLHERIGLLQSWLRGLE